MIWKILNWLVLGLAIFAYKSGSLVAAIALGVLTALMLWADTYAAAVEAKGAQSNGLLAQALQPGSGVSKLLMFVVGVLIFTGTMLVQHLIQWPQ